MPGKKNPGGQKKLEIIYLEAGNLCLLEGNPRTISDPDAIAKIKGLIKGHGFQNPLQVFKEKGGKYSILCGNHRFTAGLALDMKEFPCIVYKGTRKMAVARAISDNKSSEWTDWDYTALKEMVADLDDGDFNAELTGFTDEEFSTMFDIGGGGTAALEGEDDAPSAPDKPKTKLGDMYQLGDHFLLCGDATDRAAVERLMGGAKADMVFTDPPYGVEAVKGNKTGGGGELRFGLQGGKNPVDPGNYKPMENDSDTKAASSFYTLCRGIDINDFIIFGGNYFADFLPPSSCWAIWDKENTGNSADVEMAWTSFDKGAKLYRWLWNGLARKGKRDEELKSRVHPTQKPVGLFTEMLKDFKADIILDGFGGSGSTMIACEKLKRKCYMIEIDPAYCDVIVERYKNLFPAKKICLLSGAEKNVIGAGSTIGRPGKKKG